MVGLTERTARPLFAIRDPEVKRKATSAVKKSLDSQKSPATGKFTKKLKESDIKGSSTHEGSRGKQRCKNCTFERFSHAHREQELLQANFP